MKIPTKLITIFFFVLAATAFAQRQPDPNVGQLKNTRKGIMDGNLVRTIFWNHGEVADWPNQPSGEWPKGSGHSYVDGVALVVAAPIVDAQGRRRHSVVTRYREDMDVSPEQIPWGFAPLPGYFNDNPKTNPANAPAISNDPRTWPSRWPDKPLDWAGLWNGFFGKGVTNADLESYVVFDDDPDEEFLFYPDPSDSSRRGLGLEVASRMFQWNQVLAQDVIFAIYFITNEGKTDYDSTYFAFHIDWGIGGTDDSADDGGNYDEDLDIAWAFDGNGYGSPGNWSPVGVGGFAFLESPGIFRDSRDNDNDGLLNERRDGGPGVFLDQYPYGVADVQAFQKFYPEHELRPHWSGDENIDWDGFEDLNNNGVWNEGEPLRDDVGADGLGPFDANYPGPDFGEADGIPTAGEPDFDFTDKDESDQIGLTGFNVFVLHEYKMENDEAYWNGLRAALPPRDKLVQNTNLGMFFSSGPFGLKAGDTQFYSMSLLFAEDINDLARTKKTVQQIYNADYRFAKPPDKPQLKAIAGDGKVVLYWDNKAELSYDPFLQDFDFEGYNIYRATDPEFLEVQTITDSYGKKRYREPIAKFDLKDGIKGLHPIDVEGIKFNLGEDSGLQHFYIDRNVKNGQTYYYAVVPYDRGLVDTTATGEISGISPSEAPSVIKVSVAGVVESTDINAAIVTPQAPAAGYVDPQIDGEIVHNGPGTGTVAVQMLDPARIKNSNSYRFVFSDTSAFAIDPAPNYTLVNTTTGDTLVKQVPILEGRATTPVTDGFVNFLFNDLKVQVLEAETGWLVGSSNYGVRVGPNNSLIGRYVTYPADFELRFYDSIVDTSEALLFGQQRIPVNFKIWNLTENRQMDFLFGDRDNDKQFSPGDSVTMVTGQTLGQRPQGSRFKSAWAIFFDHPNGASPKPPKAGDIYRLVVSKPFRRGESFEFKVRGARVEPQLAKNSLSNIAVVPNPYVGGASWEPRNPFQFGRGERRIYFINLPAKCTIRIYTMRGYLVDTLVHEAPAENGAEAWDLVSKDGMDIAYGVYVYHVDAPELGTQIGKFAVIK
ncbi:MAG: hypothetical protein ALAOOOJD_03802 [bacterium]|nr:hypothetical protein [bacterium]